MKYEPIFKLPQNDIFMTDLFLRAYSSFQPIVTIINGKWVFYVSEQKLKELAEEGFSFALKPGFFKEFEKEALEKAKEMQSLSEENVSLMDNIAFSNFLDKIFNAGKNFIEHYRKTEFVYFSKVEKELEVYMGKKFNFQNLLSGKVDISLWPEEKKNLASYIISMQHLKFDLRKIMNAVMMGNDSILAQTIGRMMELTNRQDSICMTLEEVKDCLSGKSIPDVSGRHVYSYVSLENGKMNLISEGSAYKKIRELEKEIPKNEIFGVPAYGGFVRGRAKIIPLSFNPEEHFYKFEKGDILVSDTTGPEMVVLMEKAAAIVTDEGGMMSHAAVVSREFGVPCIVGTKYATEIFKDGDMLEVNANNGLVRRID